MPRLPAKQREAEKVATKLPDGSYAAAVNDSPARFSWNEHAARLLSKLSGDRRKRKAGIEIFINQLKYKREEFRKEKKTGAGSTTEAIEFYNHVLKMNESFKAKAGKKSSKGSTNASSSGKGKGKGKMTSAAVPVDEDEFLSQHNDICEVCGIGGELICCATCNLVFHLNCTRPKLTSMSSVGDTWSCAHCDATGVTHYKKDSRQRRRAITAVREMEKLAVDMKQAIKDRGTVTSTGEVVLNLDANADADATSAAEGGKEGTTSSTSAVGANEMIAEEKDKDASGLSASTSASASASTSTLFDPDVKCKVCSFPGLRANDGNDLLTCSQPACINQFHIPCYRPIFEGNTAIPTPAEMNIWSCAYCDVDFVTGLKPQARRRRASVSGVRAMDKLKIEYDEQRANGELEQPPTPVREYICIAATGSNCNSGNKRKLVDYDSATPGGGNEMEGGLGISNFNMNTPVHPGQPRSQRPKIDVDDADDSAHASLSPSSSTCAPTIYPPGPRYAREDIATDLYKRLRSKGTNSNSRHGQYNCKFCMDSELSDTCCFCACRICFIKSASDKEQTILCDLCDGEYHTHCLVPPLLAEEIPSEDEDWYCPTCTTAITNYKSSSSGKSSKGSTASVASSSSKSKPEKKKNKVGRPKGSTNKSSAQTAKKSSSGKSKASSKSAKKVLRDKKAFFSSNQPRTTTGRFASKAGDSPRRAFSDMEDGMGAPLPIKRGPGRPPKAYTKAKQAAAQRQISQHRKLVAAQAKYAAENTGVGGNDGPAPMFGANGMLATMTQQRSRSGRVVKRNTVYDEVEEQAQLMKTPSSDAGLYLHTGIGTYPGTKKEMTVNVSVSLTGAGTMVASPESASVVASNSKQAKPSTAAMLAAQAASTIQYGGASVGGSILPTGNAATTINMSSSSNYPLQSSPVPGADYQKSFIQSSQMNQILHPSPAKSSSATGEKPSLSFPPGSTSGSGPGQSSSRSSYSSSKNPRRKPGARECMQISRRFGASIVPKQYMKVLMDYCSRGKVEHLIRMRERLDEHSRFLESQLAGLEVMVEEKAEKGRRKALAAASAPAKPPKSSSTKPKISVASAPTSTNVVSTTKASIATKAGTNTVVSKIIASSSADTSAAKPLVKIAPKVVAKKVLSSASSPVPALIPLVPLPTKTALSTATAAAARKTAASAMPTKVSIAAAGSSSTLVASASVEAPVAATAAIKRQASIAPVKVGAQSSKTAPPSSGTSIGKTVPPAKSATTATPVMAKPKIISSTSTSISTKPIATNISSIIVPSTVKEATATSATAVSIPPTKSTPSKAKANAPPAPSTSTVKEQGRVVAKASKAIATTAPAPPITMNAPQDSSIVQKKGNDATSKVSAKSKSVNDKKEAN